MFKCFCLCISVHCIHKYHKHNNNYQIQGDGHIWSLDHHFLSLLLGNILVSSLLRSWGWLWTLNPPAFSQITGLQASSVTSSYTISQLFWLPSWTTHSIGHPGFTLPQYSLPQPPNRWRIIGSRHYVWLHHFSLPLFLFFSFLRFLFSRAGVIGVCMVLDFGAGNQTLVSWKSSMCS